MVSAQTIGQPLEFHVVDKQEREAYQDDHDRGYDVLSSKLNVGAIDTVVIIVWFVIVDCR